MRAQHPPVDVDDLARVGGAGTQLLDHRGVVAVGHEADVLAVGLVRHRQPVARRQRPGLGLARQVAEREAQEVELFRRGGEQEIGLVAVRVARGVQFRAMRADLALDVVPGGHAVGLEVLRGLQQVLELHPLVAADAGHRRRPGEVAVGEFVDHRLAEGVLVVENVMRKAHLLGHPAGVVDVAPGAAGALLGQRRAVVVELERHAHHVVALVGQHRRDDRGIHPARHRHHDTGVPGRLRKAE